MSSHANRGSALEDLIEAQNAVYRSRGIAVVAKVPTPWKVQWRGGKIAGAFPERKGICDYVGCAGARAVGIEAKETEIDRLAWDKIPDHQRDWLSAYDRAGAIAGVVILWAGRGEVWAVPWRDIAVAMVGQRKSLPWQAGSRYRVTQGVGVCDYLARLVELERAA